MAGRIRVLDSGKRVMQRLGYLKLLCALVNESDTSNLASLGNKLIDRITKRVKVTPPFTGDLKNYVKNRLTDGTYRELRKDVLGEVTQNPVAIEIQDIYLADKALPSRTGKLVQEDWRRYPTFATALDLIKKGTYSGLTRSIVLLAVTPKEELSAFQELDMEHNPMRISDPQSIVLLYCLIDNDAEVLVPFFRALLALPDNRFDERLASDLLPEIFRKIIANHRNEGSTAEERDHLTILGKTASTIEKWKTKEYTGGGAREETVRVRLEPYCDLGFIEKPDKDGYTYQVTESLGAFTVQMEVAKNIDQFLEECYFQAYAASRQWEVEAAKDDEATHFLVKAGEDLKSALGYSPITDVGLLAGVRLLTEKRLILELSRTTEILKALQKRYPDFVRFTVDRMGKLAYVKFLKSVPGDLL